MPACKHWRIALLCLLGSASASAEGLVELWRHVQQEEPRLGIVAARVEIANARLKASRAGLLPQVVAQGSYSRNSTERTQPLPLVDNGTQFDGKRYGINLQQPLFDLSRWRSFQSEQALVEQSGHETDRVVAELRGELLQRYLEAVAAEAALALARQEEETAVGQAEQTRALQSRQLAKVTDALLAEARVDALRARTVRAQADLEVARGSLATLTGLDSVRTLSLDGSRSLPALEGPESRWQEAAAGQSAELKALQAAELRARRQVKQEQARRLPVLTLDGSYQDSNVDYNNLYSPRTRAASVGISVSVPLFTSGTIGAAISEARAQHRIAELELDGAGRQLTQSVREAWQLASGLRAQAAAAQTAVESSQQTLTATERAYELNAATLAETLDARRDLFVARRDLVQVKLAYLHQWALLQRISSTLDDHAFGVIDSVIRVAPVDQ